MPRAKKRTKEEIIPTLSETLNELPEKERAEMAERMHCFAMGWKARDAIKKKPGEKQALI